MKLDINKMKQEKTIKLLHKQIEEDLHEATLTNLGTGEFVSVCVNFKMNLIFN